ncbi:hypothetical protein [Caulobacter sp. 17J80-11]|uniref:hypothetical protein n=1 Tax=Caulobacter sp. 17J80-11 TaxID=2763502 RepID=UPI0016536FCF|nr:hypothetical protein [Caulobacter sp. 17J80-11]MBC6980348.1 hypothetical protein [Caulobacter sp. 17J80-11]
MDVAYVSALAALGGSIIGGLTSGFTSWMNLRSQARAARLAHDLAGLEDLFRDFIVAASGAYGDATQSDQPKIQDMVGLYGMISRMRIRCTPRTIDSAEKVMETIIGAYFSPNKSIPDLQALMKSERGVDPLKEFAEAAREELGAFSQSG